MKECTQCNQTKSLDSFGVRKTAKDGRKSACKLCLNNKQKNFYKSDKGQQYYTEYESSDKRRELNKKKYRSEKSQKRIHKYLSTPEVRDRLKKYHKDYSQTDKYKLSKKIWRQNNRDKKNYDFYIYYTTKNNAGPKWLNYEHKQLIKDMYKQAQDLRKKTGNIYHVDHIIPLRGENVCGLHVPWNLQVITAEENLRKGNRYE